MEDQRLFKAILERYSVRQYKQEVLTADRMAQVGEIIEQRKPLVNRNIVEFFQINEINAVDLLVAQGPYGAFVSSPHVLVPYTTSTIAPLIEIGFQVQQVVVRLYQAGLGSCYLGTASRERSIIRHFKLPTGVSMGATVIYGLPKKEATRNIANYFRKPGYRTKRKPYEEFFSMHVYDNPSVVPERFEKIFSAARRAPSAVNAQPWKFVLEENTLFLFVDPLVYPFVLNQKSRTTYAMHDAGIVMANVYLACQAMGIEKQWVLYEHNSVDYPTVPDGIVPVAKMVLE